MTDQRELDRLLDAFFVEGPDELADRVIDAALDEIDRTRQRRVLRMPLRFPPMNLFARLATAAIICMVAVAGTVYLVQPGRPGNGGPGPAPRASTSPSPLASPSPSPVVVASYVAGSETVTVTIPGTQTQAGDVTRLRGRFAATVDTMGDPRVNGTGTITTNFDMYGQVGPQWGTYRLENAGGAWEGKWTGALWEGGSATNLSAWLVGSGAYEGWTYYAHVWGTSSLQVEGVIFPGSPPTAAALPSSSPLPSSSSPLPSSSPSVGASPAYLTGTGTLSATGGTDTLVGGVRQVRNLAIVSEATVSDPRVNGTDSALLNGDFYPAVGPTWGTGETANAEGGWKGTDTGAGWDQDSDVNRSDSTSWSVGSGAYEGWTYYGHLRATGNSFMIEGIIFPGPPPTP